MDRGTLSEGDSREPGLRPAQPAPFRPLATHAIIAINGVVFAAMALSGAGLLLPDSKSLIAWGANYAPLLVSGEWWRAVTSAFVHVGAIHLLVNMWALRAVGPFVERVYGTAGFTCVYLASAVLASLCSALRRDASAAAGASGAIFGVFGALLAFLVARRHVIQPAALARLRSSVMSVVVINLAAGFALPFIDNRAHLGGLAAGFLCGVAAWPRSAPGTLRPASWPRALAAAIVLGAPLAGYVATMPREDPMRDNQEIAAAMDSLKSEWSRLEGLQEDLGRRQAAGATHQELADAFERDVMPGWEALVARFDRLPERARARDTELLEVLALRRDTARALLTVLRTNAPADIERHNALYQQLQERLAAREQRLSAEGEKRETDGPPR